jgi:hypothetical protein
MIMVAKTVDSYRFLDAIQKHGVGQRSGFLESTRRTTLSHRPWSVHPSARETLEIVLAHRLHHCRRRPIAAKLRADPKTGGREVNWLDVAAKLVIYEAFIEGRALQGDGRICYPCPVYGRTHSRFSPRD